MCQGVFLGEAGVGGGGQPRLLQLSVVAWKSYKPSPKSQPLSACLLPGVGSLLLTEKGSFMSSEVDCRQKAVQMLRLVSLGLPEPHWWPVSQA